jgi:hypothetical protein
MPRRRPSPAEIIPPSDTSEHSLLGWDDMVHHRPPPTAPTPLPSAILVQLLRTLETATTLCKDGDINRVVAASMLKALGPVVRREQWWQQRKANELHFSEADAKLASKIENLLSLGGEGPEYTRLQISNYLYRNSTSEEISRALSLLRRSGRALSREKVRFPGHKGAELWRLVRPTDFRYPPPAPDAGLPQPPKAIYGGIVRHRPAGAELSWGEDTALPLAKPPIWGNDDDPRVLAAKQRWLARQRGDNPRARPDPRPNRAPPAGKRRRWE